MDRINSRENFFLRNATTLAIGVVTLLLLLAIAIFYRQSNETEHARRMVAHTYEVLEHIQSYFNKMKDAGLGQRGYLITGREDYLEPYIKATTPSAAKKSRVQENQYSVMEELDILKKLTIDNIVQQRNLEELEETSRNLLDYLAETVKERRAKRIDAAIHQEVESLEGKQYMDHIRILVRVMIAEEQRLLDIRTALDEVSARQVTMATFVGTGVFYLILVLSIIFYQRYRNRAQAELLRYTRELENSEEELQRGEEELRTQQEELQAANEELEEQNAQIRQQSEALKESQHLIEEKMRELEQAGKYKSEFLANMSHELRTPLNSLLILSRSLSQNEEGNLTEEQVEEAKIIYNGGMELLELINDILDLSKVEAGKLSFVMEDVFTEGMVKRMRQQFAPVGKERNLEFKIEVSADFPQVLYTDAQRAEQVLKNLLSNAFKFTEKGAVTLSFHCPSMASDIQRESLKGGAVALSVTDTGVGIDASKFKDIFEAFQQEDGATDRQYGGTGLGLTIARKFAHMLGGEIQVASEKGKGSTFTLLLPKNRLAENQQIQIAVAAAVEENKPAQKQGAKTQLAEFIADDRNAIGERDKVLLIVEDDANFAGVLMKMAHKHGYKCLAAGDGKTALLLAVEWRISAILLDLGLPDMHGTEVMEQLKHDLRTRHIPVHIITGDSEEHYINMLRKGAIGYLTKPVEAETIHAVFSKIEGLLEKDIKHVLVIEDDSKTQKAIQSLLKKQDIELTITNTGKNAMELLHEKPFDCIVLDLRLPDMTGFDWLKAVSEERGDLNSPPVIIYTAKELTEEENRVLSLYTNSIIIKGAKSPERLLDEVTLFLHSVEATLSKDQQEMIRMQHNPDQALQGRTILLVDDDLRNSFALSKLLKKHGMGVQVADNGQMALDKLKEDPSIDLVIMDIMMPIMDGYQAMRAIRDKDIWKNLPIIALTARAMPEEQQKCMEAGANDYLTKPVDVERLLTLLRVWLFKRQAA